MPQAISGAISLPDPDAIRARIDQLDAEAQFLRRLLRLVVRADQREPSADHADTREVARAR